MEKTEKEKEMDIRLELDAFWYRVLQIALYNHGVHSLGKTAEVTRMSMQEVMDLQKAINKIFVEMIDGIEKNPQPEDVAPQRDKCRRSRQEVEK
jgi:hypothetical protein